MATAYPWGVTEGMSEYALGGQRAHDPRPGTAARRGYGEGGDGPVLGGQGLAGPLAAGGLQELPLGKALPQRQPAHLLQVGLRHCR